MKSNRTRVAKTPIDPERIRRIPRSGFSWIDRRFVREGFLGELPGESIVVYFFLVAVADAQGLSFWADPTVTRLLKISAEELVHARYWLAKAGLVLYRDPIYQVVALPSRPALASDAPSPALGRGGEPRSIGDILDAACRARQGEERERPS